MRATYWICLGLGAGLAFGLAGCKDLDQCEDPGVTQACMCGAEPGARVCQPEFVWSDCDCGAAVPDSGTTGGAGGMTGGAGGMTGGAGGMTGGAGGMTGGMGGMTGGMGGMTGGMGGMTGGMGGMGGMTGGMGGDTPTAAARRWAASRSSRSLRQVHRRRPPKRTAAPARSAACRTRRSAASKDLRSARRLVPSPTIVRLCQPASRPRLSAPHGQCVLTCSTNILAPVPCPTGMTCAQRTLSRAATTTRCDREATRLRLTV